MELREYKFEISMAALFVLLCLGLFRGAGSFFKTPTLEIGQISYEMPRPKSDMVGEFGLGDREIDRKYNQLQKKGPADAKKVSAENVKTAAAPKAVQAKRTLPGQWMVVRQARQQNDLRVVEKTPSGLGGEGGGSANQSPRGANNNGGRAVAPTNPQEVPQEDEQLSPGQWQALFSAQPTKENMDRFVAAYAGKKVDSNTFYGIMNRLLESQNQDHQLLAIYGMGKYPESNGFALVARSMGSLSNEAVQSQAMTYLQSFSSPSRHGALRSALSSHDTTVSYYAAQVVLDGLTSASGGEGPRIGRGQAVLSGSGTASYTQFIPIVQALTNSEDENLRNIANQILGLLPTSAA